MPTSKTNVANIEKNLNCDVLHSDSIMSNEINERSCDLLDDGLDRESLEQMKNVCLNAYANVENFGIQARKENEVLINTPLTCSLLKYSCKKTLWFLNFVEEKFASDKKEVEAILKDVENRQKQSAVIETSNNCADTTARLCNLPQELEWNRISKKGDNNKLSRKRMVGETDTQDDFFNSVESDDMFCESFHQSEIDNSPQKVVETAPSATECSFKELCAEFGVKLKDKSTDYDTFDQRDDVGKLMDDLLNKVLSIGASKASIGTDESHTIKQNDSQHILHETCNDANEVEVDRLVKDVVSDFNHVVAVVDNINCNTKDTSANNINYSIPNKLGDTNYEVTETESSNAKHPSEITVNLNDIVINVNDLNVDFKSDTDNTEDNDCKLFKVEYESGSTQQHIDSRFNLNNNNEGIKAEEKEDGDKKNVNETDKTQDTDCDLDRNLGNNNNGVIADSDCDIDDYTTEISDGLNKGVEVSNTVMQLKERRMRELEAIRVLENIGCDTSDCDSTSGDTVSDESDIEEIVMHKLRRPAPKEILIEKDFFLEDTINFCDLLQIQENMSKSSNEHIYYEKFNLKECSVELMSIDNTKLCNQDNLRKTFYDKELREIERLTNIDSLKRTRRKSSSSLESDKTVKKRKVSTKKTTDDTEYFSDSDVLSDLDDLDVTCNSPPVNISNMTFGDGAAAAFVPNIDSDDVIKEIINYTFTDDDHSDDDDDDEMTVSSDETDVKRETRQNKDKEKTEYNMKEKPVKAVQEKFIDEETLKRKKWRYDKLLTQRISDSSSNEEDDTEQKKAKSDKHAKKRKKAADKDDSVKNKAEEKANLIALSSDSESDVEFVKTIGANSFKQLIIDSDDDDSDVDDVRKSGRRNIRAVKSYESLEEATKRAAKEEDERTQRLLMKEKTISIALSQVSTVLLQGLVLDVDEESNEPVVSVNIKLTGKLKDHQKDGIRFMWNTCYESVKRLQTHEGTGCILAHCMGLGKTLQAIALIHTLFTHPVTSTKHVLIVCPLSTVLNWENEFKIGIDDLNDDFKLTRFLISNASSYKASRMGIIKKWRQSGGVLIMGYEAYQSLVKSVQDGNKGKEQIIQEALVDPGPDLVICDEGHLLKNGKNNRTKSLMKIKTKRRIILTGTPLQNNLVEYYYMVQFVKPNLLGTLQEYSNRFVNPIVNGQYDDSTDGDIQLMRKRSHVLHKILKQTVQRYEITELSNYLPQMTDYVINVRLHSVQVEMYKTYLDKIRGESVKNSRLFSDFHNLRNVWTHPYLLYLVEQHKPQLEKKTELEVDTINLESITINSEESTVCNKDNYELPRGWWKDFCPADFKTNLDYGPKFKIMFGILEECEKRQDKVLIFSSSLAELNCIEYFLKTHGTPGCPNWKRKEHYLRMDGTVPPETRMTYCNYFNNPDNATIRAFLISHRVGGLGLNLVAANRIILMDVHFNPAYDLQSIFRIYRFGQKKQCYIYRLVAKGTMEEVVYERSVTKLAVAGRVVDQLQISRHYKSSELQKMYRFKLCTDEPAAPLNNPADNVLSVVIENCKSQIHSCHEHQSLLENLSDEVLNEAEMKIAWDEFNEEKTAKNKDIEKLQAPSVSDHQYSRCPSFVSRNLYCNPTQKSIVQELEEQQQSEPGCASATFHTSKKFNKVKLLNLICIPKLTKYNKSNTLPNSRETLNEQVATDLRQQLNRQEIRNPRMQIVQINPQANQIARSSNTQEIQPLKFWIPPTCASVIPQTELGNSVQNPLITNVPNKHTSQLSQSTNSNINDVISGLHHMVNDTPLADVQLNSNEISAVENTEDLSKEGAKNINKTAMRESEDNGTTTDSIRTVILDRYYQIIAPPARIKLAPANKTVTDELTKKVVESMAQNMLTKNKASSKNEQVRNSGANLSNKNEKATKSIQCESTVVNFPRIIDVEQEDLLKQISCNDSLTLSTVLKEMEKTVAATTKSGNVIEID